jgi:hypothetical protein
VVEEGKGKSFGAAVKRGSFKAVEGKIKNGKREGRSDVPTCRACSTGPGLQTNFSRLLLLIQHHPKTSCTKVY